MLEKEGKPRACCKYQDFVDRGKLLTDKLFSQGYRKAKLVSTVKKFYGRHHDLVDPYSGPVSEVDKKSPRN